MCIRDSIGTYLVYTYTTTILTLMIGTRLHGVTTYLKQHKPLVYSKYGNYRKEVGKEIYLIYESCLNIVGYNEYC